MEKRFDNDYRNLTLCVVSDMIDLNIELSNLLNLRLWWGFEKKLIRSKVFDGEKELLNKLYDIEHIPILLTYMHLDFNTCLQSIYKARQIAAYQTTGVEPKMYYKKEG